jgi:predicted small lipoprotein YifL
MKPSSCAALAAALAAILAGCGQKGALYLPPKGTAISTPPPAESTPARTPAPNSPVQTPPQNKSDKDDDTSPPQ